MSRDKRRARKRKEKRKWTERLRRDEQVFDEKLVGKISIHRHSGSCRREEGKSLAQLKSEQED